MQEYLYLFRGGDARRAQQSPEAMQEHMGKWTEWMNGLGVSGHLIGGQPLQAEGKLVSGNGRAELVTDGPYAEGKEIVGGYLLIKAENIEEATELSKGCPIFEHNGTVEVRPIQSM